MRAVHEKVHPICLCAIIGSVSVPAMAENPAPFHAMSQLSTGLTETAKGSAVNPMTDEQLAGVEGGVVLPAVIRAALREVLGVNGSAALLADVYAKLGGCLGTELSRGRCNCNVP